MIIMLKQTSIAVYFLNPGQNRPIRTAATRVNEAASQSRLARHRAYEEKRGPRRFVHEWEGQFPWLPV